MITLEKIKSELINFSEEDELADNIVAVAVKLDVHGVARHSGILIGYRGEFFLFHYTGQNVELESPIPTAEWYFCKELEIINGEELARSFKAFCEMILEEEDPNYGFWFDSSWYNEDGSYFTEGPATNFTTCVGFCIKVISGFIQKKGKYFELSDWDLDSVNGFRDAHPSYYEEYLNNFRLQNPNISDDDFKRFWKRITPTEYTASAFLNDLPIRRESIQSILSNVDIALRERRLAGQ